MMMVKYKAKVETHVLNIKSGKQLRMWMSCKSKVCTDIQHLHGTVVGGGGNSGCCQTRTFLESLVPTVWIVGREGG